MGIYCDLVFRNLGFDDRHHTIMSHFSKDGKVAMKKSDEIEAMEEEAAIELFRQMLIRQEQEVNHGAKAQLFDTK